MPKFSTIMKPVNDLLSAAEAIWKEEHTQAVHKVMDRLEEDCVLKLPNYEKPFYVATDYSGVGIGAVLMQHDDDNRLRPLQSASRSLTE